MPPNRLNGRTMGSNTAHRILLSPEVLDMIFKNLDDKDLANAARVCRLWSPIALDVLWREIEDLKVLLQLLAPMKKRETEKDLRFERPPDPNGWRRFNDYAKRVRKLIYHTETKPFIHRTAFDDLARTRTRVDILPNLQDLVWNEHALDSSLLFMHERVRAFAVSLTDRTSVQSLPAYFDEIVFRMPNLTTLDIRSRRRVSEYENELGKLLTSLPKLSKIVLPRYYVTSRLAEELSRLEHLEVLEFQYHDVQGMGHPEDVVVFNPTFSEGAFLALWDLSLTISFQNAINLLSGSFSPSNITMLHIDSDTSETTKCTQELLATISDACQNLTYLGLSSFQAASLPGTNTQDHDYAEYTVTFETLSPLFKLANLTRLEIKHQYPIAVTIQDLERMASHWPMLDTFVLNDEPAHLHTSALTLEALLPFARHCPHITHLGLFMDANAYCPSLDPECPSYDPTKVASFTSLRLLTVGVSPIDQDERPTLYLSQMLPQKCGLESGVTWDVMVETPGDVSGIVRDRCDMWENVARLLPMMIRLRAEERVRSKVMERELVQLKTRTGVIRDLASE